MAKTNTERQAEFRERMRKEGKQVLNVWVTPEQAEKIQAILTGQAVQSLQVTKAMPPDERRLLVTNIMSATILPKIPVKTPETIARDLTESKKLIERKRKQIDKLTKDAKAIEKYYIETVERMKKY